MNCGVMKATRATISEIPILKSSRVCISNIKKWMGIWRREGEHLREIKIIMPMIQSPMVGRYLKTSWKKNMYRKFQQWLNVKC